MLQGKICGFFISPRLSRKKPGTPYKTLSPAIPPSETSFFRKTSNMKENNAEKGQTTRYSGCESFAVIDIWKKHQK